MGSWLCPNIECSNHEHLKRGEKCPSCGSEAQEFGFMDLGTLIVKKKDFQKYGASSLKVAFTADMTTEQIRDAILKGLEEAKRLEESFGWNKTLTVLSGGGNVSEVAMVLLLKTVVEQNKVIIRQNELLYRVLTRKTP